MFRPRRVPADAETEKAPPVRPGTVTRLVAQAHDAARVSVHLDGAFAFGVHGDLVLDFGLAKGRFLSAEDQTAIRTADARLVARSTALAFLSHRARTEREVRQRLAEAGVPEDTVEETAAWLRERGYLDDTAFAEGYVQSRQSGAGYGPERVRRELVRRGVGRTEADAAVGAGFAAGDVAADALRQGAARLRLLAREADPRKRRKKLFDFLVRRGFAFDVAADAVGRLLQGGADDAEDGPGGDAGGPFGDDGP